MKKVVLVMLVVLCLLVATTVSADVYKASNTELSSVITETKINVSEGVANILGEIELTALAVSPKQYAECSIIVELPYCRIEQGYCYIYLTTIQEYKPEAIPFVLFG